MSTSQKEIESEGDIAVLCDSELHSEPYFETEAKGDFAPKSENQANPEDNLNRAPTAENYHAMFPAQTWSPATDPALPLPNLMIAQNISYYAASLHDPTGLAWTSTGIAAGTHLAMSSGTMPTQATPRRLPHTNLYELGNPHHLAHGNGEHISQHSLPRMQGVSQGLTPLRAGGMPIPRPHPHLPTSTLFLSHIPADLAETAMAQALQECLPFRIQADKAVEPINGSARHDLMPRSATVIFDAMYDLEKAMATLPVHPFMVERGVFVSPYPPPQMLPYPDLPVAARYLRPTILVHPPKSSQNDTPVTRFMSSCPSPGELFDAIRLWGSLRQVSVWAHRATDSNERERGSLKWGAKVEFWYEDEARNFEVGFGQTGSIVKGWQLIISAEDVNPNVHHSSNMAFPSPAASFSMATCGIKPIFHPYEVNGCNATHLGSMPTPPSSFVPLSGWSQDGLPPTPSTADVLPTWSNPYNYGGSSNLPALLPTPSHSPDQRIRAPSISTTDGGDRQHIRRRSTSSRSCTGYMRGAGHSRQRTWSVAIDEIPGGGIKATGLLADDGTFISHGPGQHIRPAPFHGPGSNSQSGLVDYNNVFVKNLDSNITSYLLGELFEGIGRIVSARVMRDDNGKTRGYGFVSFQTPEEAAHAIEVMNGTTVYNQTISVTLHEPRKLRPEKLAERHSLGLSMRYGRQSHLARRSSSPVRTDRRGRRATSDEPKYSGADSMRTLFPKARKSALAQLVGTHVKAFASANAVPNQNIEPAVDAQAGQDLSLIPLRSHRDILDARIAEMFGVIQDDSGFNPTLSGVQMDELRQTPEGKAPIQAEIERIDPIEPDQVKPIPPDDLSADVLQRSEADGTFSTEKYNAAKKEVVHRQKEQQRDGRSTRDNLRAVEETVDQAVPPRVLFALAESEQITGDIELRRLARLPATDIIAYLSGPHTDAILCKLCINAPDTRDLITSATWRHRASQKPMTERKSEITSQLIKRLDAYSFKRSQKIAAAKGLVDAEDEHALCELMLYPTILRAKVKAYIDEPEHPAST